MNKFSFTAQVETLLRSTIKRFFIITTVEGESMQPTLVHGDIIIAFRIYPRTWIRRHQIVLLSPSMDQNNIMVKRVVGIGGDTVMRDHDLHYSELYLEKYSNNVFNDKVIQYHVPQGCIFVVGDNAFKSSDSFTWGPVPIRCALGVVLLKLRA